MIKMSSFDIAAKRYDAISKVAFAALAAKAFGYGAKALKSVGSTVMKNPGTTAVAGFNALDVASQAAAGAKGKNVGTFLVDAAQSTM